MRVIFTLIYFQFFEHLLSKFIFWKHALNSLFYNVFRLIFNNIFKHLRLPIDGDFLPSDRVDELISVSRFFDDVETGQGVGRVDVLGQRKRAGGGR